MIYKIDIIFYLIVIYYICSLSKYLVLGKLVFNICAEVWVAGERYFKNEKQFKCYTLCQLDCTATEVILLTL